ncbi:MAG TPA: DUF481 domain-containing protein [Silvibacterium sp.]|nr:DUF481 domain-containing protein [Silvibacterium sp.]
MHRNLTTRPVLFALLLALLSFTAIGLCHADSPTLFGGGKTKSAPKAAPGPPPDVIIFINGDQLSGTFLREVGGKVTFHNDIVGDIIVPWDKIKELRTRTKMAVMDKNATPRRGKLPANLPEGTLTIADSLITVHADNNATIQPIPVNDAQFIIDEDTLNREVFGHPSLSTGWNGGLTAGATIVEATQKQYTFTGAVALARVIPSIDWLDPKNRTTVDFNASYGKITQPAFTTGGVFTPASSTKSAIYHAEAERDQYFSPRAYGLVQTAFDHNFSQGLDLQQIYGGGIGDTILKHPNEELDIKATIQYEKQSFINSSGASQNLIGSTFAGVYLLKLPNGLLFNQQVEFIPAYNNSSAYSANESDTLAIPFYKSLSFSVGTLDSYLNNPPVSLPPTMKNSFQFTFGATYVIKSKY